MDGIDVYFMVQVMRIGSAEPRDADISWYILVLTRFGLLVRAREFVRIHVEYPSIGPPVRVVPYIAHVSHSQLRPGAGKTTHQSEYEVWAEYSDPSPNSLGVLRCSSK